MANDKKDIPKKPIKENLNRFVKYSTLGFEMIAIIGLGAWAGYSLDEYFENKTPGFTIAFSLFAIFGSLYLIIKRVLNDK